MRRIDGDPTATATPRRAREDRNRDPTRRIRFRDHDTRGATKRVCAFPLRPGSRFRASQALAFSAVAASVRFT